MRRAHEYDSNGITRDAVWLARGITEEQRLLADQTAETMRNEQYRTSTKARTSVVELVVKRLAVVVERVGTRRSPNPDNVRVVPEGHNAHVR